jgi:hypothetical protein
MNVASGAHYNTSGGWIADAPNAAFMAQGGGNTRFFGNTGLTAGSSYGPTEVAGITPTGLTMRTVPTICSAPASVSGGPSLNAGSNSFLGVVVGTVATGNVLTIGCNCPNALHGILLDIQGGGPVVPTARTVNSITFNVTTPPHAVTYVVSCN